jgi:type IV pilus assembly protein PilA
MLTAIKQRLDRDEEEGFTLIELMVVVLIIAILLAIAIPTFLGARNAANARAAQSNLRNALTAEQTNWTNTQAFTVSAATIEPSLTWATQAASTSGPNTVGVVVPAGNNQVVITALGKDKNCWTIAQTNDPAVTYDGTQYYMAPLPTTGVCASPTAPTAAAATTATSAAAAASTWSSAF